MTKPFGNGSRYTSWYQELRAELERYPGKMRFSVPRKLLEGLIAEMDWAATKVLKAEEEAQTREGEP